MRRNTLLIIASSEADADLYYETGFFAPDPFIFIGHSGKKILLLSELEVDRAKREARVDEVLSIAQYKEKFPRRKRSKIGFKDIVDLVFKERGIKGALVPGSFPIKYADELRRLGYKVRYKKEEPFFDKRKIKTKEEMGYIRKSLRKAEKAMDSAIVMIALSEIKGKRLMYKGRTLTSEMVKEGINSELSKMGCAASHTIVACGIHSSMPHHEGEGALRAGEPIVIDIFPRSTATGYWGDITRTVVKGEPSEELSRMYDTVLRGQKLGFSLIKDGVKVKEVHESIKEFFKESGYETGVVDGKNQGFIHSTGHGLGLEIHEPPRVGSTDDFLEAGNVITVEPGLYYEKLGGIRIEDVVVVEKDGYRNITRYPKKFKV